MNSPQNNTKVYIEIVKQLRSMIEHDGLKPGDRLPSERELSERLGVGRSSVREALRALELLGLIETRRGEGTFIRDFRGNQLVQLLSTFILQDQKAIRDVKETKFLIELDCLWLIIQKAEKDQLLKFKNWALEADYTEDEFFLEVVTLADNHLFLRIWMILKDYYNSLDLKKMIVSKTEYAELIDTLISKNESEVIRVYKNLRKLSKG
ncbi:DNA-binding FadR family transcriptional regulator [Cytobacillus oceanisediminis]|uniref:DNA-binding FadR family transcriptional regulator n=2 Tax=Cytobacillus oceanisediminis TaxID=665099 RepID=A0A2V2ZUF3_9BACI|nr:GntR family transcriptional regulator [Cytobacillus oceanisediminis]PWW26102.1 DNA-binding FadR family transcriptional regulator [Cytobacillus oceanisediminis]